MDPQKPVPESSSPSPSPPDWRQRALLLSGILALVAATGLWIFKALQPPGDDGDDSPSQKINSPSLVAKKGSKKTEFLPPPRGLPHGFNKGKRPTSFLEAFGDKGTLDNEDKGPVLPNDQLEKRFEALMALEDRMRALEAQISPPGPKPPPPEEEKKLAELKKLFGQQDQEIAALEKDLARARRARPRDPIPQWLTGELLIFIHAEPELIQPFLQRAIDSGLDTPRLWASISRVQIQANQFQAAYQSALNALEKGRQEPYAWYAFTRAAFSLEEFSTAAQKLDQAFAKDMPSWAREIRKEAEELQAKWEIEKKLRRADQKANLPRIRLVIEHRRFVTEDGKITTKIESTGREEVVLELFEDQAPNTVANFLTLVEQKFYDGTRFFLAEPATLVAGGCPKTRNADPAGDGTGGPGYSIPDECKTPNARSLFRGTLAMAKPPGKDNAGSQFFITLSPQPHMDGIFTAFGRVIEGQKAVDHITLGRTNPEVGPFGKLIPGDLLVRAEVIRKRPHPYKVIKIGKE